jgi:hypothetical protein
MRNALVRPINIRASATKLLTLLALESIQMTVSPLLTLYDLDFIVCVLSEAADCQAELHVGTNLWKGMLCCQVLRSPA